MYILSNMHLTYLTNRARFEKESNISTHLKYCPGKYFHQDILSTFFYPHWSNIAQGCNQWSCHVIGQHEILGMGYFKGHLWVYNRALKKVFKIF